MPSESKAQHRLMEAVAHSRSTAAKLGISQKTAREFVSHDKGRNVSKLPEHVKKK